MSDQLTQRDELYGRVLLEYSRTLPEHKKPLDQWLNHPKMTTGSIPGIPMRCKHCDRYCDNQCGLARKEAA